MTRAVPHFNGQRTTKLCANCFLTVERWYRVEMPGRGLEPLRISPPDPKSGASANFATLAIGFLILDLRFAIANRAAGATGFSMRIGYGESGTDPVFMRSRKSELA